MAESVCVVVHFLDGSLLKGTTRDFRPKCSSFHLIPADGTSPVEVLCRHLKAIFFVKDLTGKRQRRDIRGFLAAPGKTEQGLKISVLFKDGEFLCGHSLTYGADREGFFMFPADPGSNNIRIYVNKSAAVEIKAGPGADMLARQMLRSRKRTA